MTKEKAIKMLKSKMDGNTDTSYEWAETVRMAIKALEQEPCEDAVSRQAVIDEIEFYQINPQHFDFVSLINDIKALPPVTPTQKWIPVSERLTEKNVEVLATTEWGEVTIAEMYSANDWFIHEGNTNAETDEIVAWMPLPQSYRAEGEEKTR